NELRLGGEPPDPAEPVGRPRGSHAFARARAQHRRMYAQAEHVPSEIVTEEGGGMFRRTRIPRSRAALDDLGRRLATEAVEMLDPALTLYPAPAPEHCGACDFRAPCLALNEGADAEAVLAAGYRPRPPETPEEGRLGAVVSVSLLARTARAANRINHKAENIAKTGQGINTATDSVIQLNRTNQTAGSILESAKPLEGKLAQVVTLAQSVDGLAKSINGTAGTINSTGGTINGTASAINGSAVKING